LLKELVKYAATGSAKQHYALKELNVNNPQCQLGASSRPHFNSSEGAE